MTLQVDPETRYGPTGKGFVEVYLESYVSAPVTVFAPGPDGGLRRILPGRWGGVG